MLIALLTDIHANREAFDACRDEARRLGAEKFVYLGDLVGYGADPAYVVDCIARDVARGAVCVMGNHDLATAHGAGEHMHEGARRVVEWSANQLDAAQVGFLASLPFTAQTFSEAGVETLYVHADASAPQKFIYVTGPEIAEQSLNASAAHVTFCGHVHRPQLYHKAQGKPAIAFRPTPNMPIPLARSRRWQVVLGSVGQPRDGNPLAAFAIYDDEKSNLSFYRIAYNIDAAARKIERAGLPVSFASRLYLGR